MKLVNVRKGQFVYYKNILHKVYAVKPFFKQSVHLIRLHDLEQEIVTAKEITYYKPKHLDSFICNEKRYTLNKGTRAEVGDYILVVNPHPDALDHYHLHAIELVSSLEDTGVISNKSNGIRHNEYWTMEKGFIEGASKIDQFDANEEMAPFLKEENNAGYEEIAFPKIGDVYQKNNADPVTQAMVVAIQGRVIHLGHNITVQASEIMDTNKWSYVLSVKEQ